MMTTIDDQAVAAALTDWRGLLGADNVLDPTAATTHYSVDTGRFGRRLGGAVRVRERRQLAAILATAQTRGVPIYAVSRGNNWGYGTANPVREGSVVVDLSGLDRIVAFDAEAGTVTV